MSVQSDVEMVEAMTEEELDRLTAGFLGGCSDLGNARVHEFADRVRKLDTEGRRAFWRQACESLDRR